MDVQEIKGLTDLRSMRDLTAEQRRPGDSEDISIQSIHLKLRQQMAHEHFQRVVVDSVTSIRRFAMKQSNDPQAERTEIQSLLRFLTEQEVTTLLTATPSPAGTLSAEEDPDAGRDPAHAEMGRGPVRPSAQDRSDARERARSRTTAVHDHSAGVPDRLDRTLDDRPIDLEVAPYHLGPLVTLEGQFPSSLARGPGQLRVSRSAVARSRMNVTICSASAPTGEHHPVMVGSMIELMTSVPSTGSPEAIAWSTTPGRSRPGWDGPRGPPGHTRPEARRRPVRRRSRPGPPRPAPPPRTADPRSDRRVGSGSRSLEARPRRGPIV